MTNTHQRARVAFTLVELLVSMAIILLLLVVLVGMINQTSTLWRSTNGHIEQFRQARDGFEAMTRRLSQATLNTYLDYVDSSGNPRTSANSTAASVAAFVPARYVRQSELRMISGPRLAGTPTSSPPRPTHGIFFQAPLGLVTDTANYGGLDNLLNTWGYYVEFNNNGDAGLNADGTGLQLLPPFIRPPQVRVPARYRFRLMELMQPSETLSVYRYTSGNAGLKSTDPSGMNWFTDALGQKGAAHVLAENIVALVVLPKLSPGDQSSGGYTDGSLAPGYAYDSTLPGSGGSDASLNSQNQLPPIVTVTMVAVDEASYNRFQGGSTTIPTNLGSAALFQTVGNTKDASAPGFAQDLQTLQNALQTDRLSYRVFTTDVSIKSAKWSRQQRN